MCRKGILMCNHIKQEVLSSAVQVVAFQVAWLQQLGVSQPYTRPQAMLAATEQGWTTYGTTNQGKLQQLHALCNLMHSLEVGQSVL